MFECLFSPALWRSFDDWCDAVNRWLDEQARLDAVRRQVVAQAAVRRSFND